jgi:Domain of unknown function (DUF5615)
MLRLLFDQDFNHDILRGLLLRLPNVDGITALQAGLAEAGDPELLDWATQQRRTVVTHDVNTMPDHAYRRLRQGELVVGLFVVPQELPIGQAIAELEVLTACSFEGEWNNLIVFVPL